MTASHDRTLSLVTNDNQVAKETRREDEEAE